MILFKSNTDFFFLQIGLLFYSKLPDYVMLKKFAPAFV